MCALLAANSAAVYRPAPGTGDAVLLAASRATPSAFWVPRLEAGHGRGRPCPAGPPGDHLARRARRPTHPVHRARARAAVAASPHGSVLVVPLVVQDRIVRNFLALARQRPPERSTVVLARVVQDALELLAYPLRLDQVEIEVAVDGEIPPLWADAHQLSQLFVNVVTNAHQALRHRTGARRIRVQAVVSAGGDHVRVEVSDTGPGIPADIRPRVFEPFFTTKPPGQGTGLGLSLCRSRSTPHPAGAASYGSSCRFRKRHGTARAARRPRRPSRRCTC